VTLPRHWRPTNESRATVEFPISCMAWRSATWLWGGLRKQPESCIEQSNKSRVSFTTIGILDALWNSSEQRSKLWRRLKRRTESFNGNTARIIERQKTRLGVSAPQAGNLRRAFSK